MISEPEASSDLPHGFPCQGGFPGAACGGTAGGESELRRSQLAFGGHYWQLQMKRGPMVIHGMQHVILKMWPVVLQPASS